jgi:hypothetical protein
VQNAALALKSGPKKAGRSATFCGDTDSLGEGVLVGVVLGVEECGVIAPRSFAGLPLLHAAVRSVRTSSEANRRNCEALRMVAMIAELVKGVGLQVL